jgi:hypothetical protein
MVTLIPTKITLASKCLDNNVYLSKENTTFVFTSSSVDKANYLVPGSFLNNITFSVKAYYSLSPFPGSVSFNCPPLHYKGFQALNTNYFGGNFTNLVKYNVYKYQDLVLNIESSFSILNCNMINFTNSSFICGFFPINIFDSLPNNCALNGNQDIIINITSTLYEFNYTLNNSGLYQPCSLNSVSCGNIILPFYNTSCCYINDIKYEGNNFLPSEANFVFDFVNLTCSDPFTWGVWQILVIVFACLMAICILAIILTICKTTLSVVKV